MIFDPDNISDDMLYRLADAARKTYFGSRVTQVVSRHFKSMHYLSSYLIRDCVAMNILLNDRKITPTSASKIITAFRRRNISLYTTVNSAFFPIEDIFEDYAREILADKYDETKKLDMRTTDYAVYVLSLDLCRDPDLYPEEIYKAAFTFEELIKYDLLPR